MVRNDLVSIIIPCYNQAQYLEESVQSAVAQTYENIEIIIVNDGSLDDTQKIAEKLQKEYPDVICLISQKNQGLSEARNRGIRESSGEYILPLDADDKIASNMISKSIKVMIHGEIDIVSTDTQCFGKETHNILPIQFPECNLLYNNCWIVASLYRRKVWVENGGYKENMQGGYEDWEFWINAYKHGFKFQRYPEVLFYYRTKAESMITAAEKQDSYLKAKIVMNHPELYTMPNVENSINIIRETEELADFYFYYEEKTLDNEQKFISEVGNYINKNSLETKQIIEVDNKQIGLLSLELLADNTSLKELYADLGTDFLLFYAPMRYKVETLQSSSFAWKIDQGIVKAKGNLFSFVFKEKRESLENQLIAYQRLVKFQDKKLNIQVLRSKDAKDTMIKNHNKEISQNNYRLEILLDAIEKVTTFSIRKNPILKYKAYKMILKTYYKLKEFKK